MQPVTAVSLTRNTCSNEEAAAAVPMSEGTILIPLGYFGRRQDGDQTGAGVIFLSFK